jgi:monofunctional biosynthetic peptidoglycan transglycosylase
VPYAQINDTLKRAVIASEDAGFVDHNGWSGKPSSGRQRNVPRPRSWRPSAPPAPLARGKPVQPVKMRGGSTITQQLAKNLLLSGERTCCARARSWCSRRCWRCFLDKQRILEIYLNNVEWGEGVFGAEAAAQYYFKKPASRLGANEAARLAVMLPSPKFFERRPGSPYLSGRASTVVARMPSAELP